MLLYLNHLLIGLGCSFIGTIPFGPINLSVINTTIRQNVKATVPMCIAAGFSEVLQAFIALQFGILVLETVKTYPQILIFIFSVFILLGIFFFFKKAVFYKLCKTFPLIQSNLHAQ